MARWCAGVLSPVLVIIGIACASGATQCDLCADNWLFVLGAGGRAGSLTALSMFRMLPGVRLTGEHGGMLKDHCTIYQKLAMEKKGLARPGPAFDPHTFYCLTQEIIKFVVYGTELEELEEKTVVVGFKEVRHVSPRTLEFMASVIPCARITFVSAKCRCAREDGAVECLESAQCVGTWTLFGESNT